MATLKLDLTAVEAPFTTQMFRYDNGLESLYYARLYTGDRRYAEKPEVWRRWQDRGFNIGSRGYMPGAAVTDRLRKTMHPDGKVVEYRFVSGNAAALEDLKNLVQLLDKIRTSLPKDEQARGKELEKNPELRRQVFEPVVSRLEKTGFTPPEIEDFVYALRRGLVALTDDEIKDVKVSVE